MCTSPLRAFYTGSKTEKGGDLLAVSKAFAGLKEVRYEVARKVAREPFELNFDYMYQDSQGYWQLYKYVDVPCGHCEECIQAYRKVWAYRCMLEAEHSRDCWFVTLTYDNIHNDGSLHKRHLQLFMKRLRKIVGPGVRFFASGEYGTHGTHRPHYHVLLFNCPMRQRLFATFELYEAWTLGSIKADPVVNMQTCAYVAGYTSKKLVDWKMPKSFTPPFIAMSRRPGIGERWISEHLDQIAETDKIYFAFSPDTLEIKPFRYADKIAEKLGQDLLDRKLAREIGMYRSKVNEMHVRRVDEEGRLYARREIAKAKERRRKERS